MSNINKDGVDMSNNTLAKLSFSAVNELNDEAAATCSGGSASIYRDGNFRGGGLTFRNGTPNLGNFNFNDITSSIIITGNQRWAFYRDVNYRGPRVVLGPGRYSWVPNFGILNDSISSLRRIA